jgi:hypothetical protein
MRPRAASCAVETSEGISSNQDSSDGLRALGAKELGRPADPEADDRGRRRAVTTTSWLGIATVGNGRIARETTLDRYYRCGLAGSTQPIGDRCRIHSGTRFMNLAISPRGIPEREPAKLRALAPSCGSVRCLDFRTNVDNCRQLARSRARGDAPGNLWNVLPANRSRSRIQKSRRRARRRPRNS